MPSYWSVSADEYTEDGEELDSTRPPFSFTCLIGLAIIASEAKKLSVGKIYEYIARNFPYFQTAKGTWKNSVRHVLSLDKFFRPSAKHHEPFGHDASKGRLWEIKPDMIEQLAEQIAEGQQLLRPSTARHLGLPELQQQSDRGGDSVQQQSSRSNKVKGAGASASCRRPRRQTKRQRMSFTEVAPSIKVEVDDDIPALPPRPRTAPEQGARDRRVRPVPPTAEATAAPRSWPAPFSSTIASTNDGHQRPQRRMTDGGATGDSHNQKSTAVAASATATIAAVPLRSSSSPLAAAEEAAMMNPGVSQSKRVLSSADSSSSSISAPAHSWVKLEPDAGTEVNMKSLAASMASIVDDDGGDIFGESIGSVFASSYNSIALAEPAPVPESDRETSLGADVILSMFGNGPVPGSAATSPTHPPPTSPPPVRTLGWIGQSDRDLLAVRCA